MKIKYLAHLLVAFLVLSCGSDKKEAGELSSNESHFFFQNSLRKKASSQDPNVGAIVEILNLKGQRNCTGFYVKNESGSVLVMTARHCMKYKVSDWCKEGGSVRDWITKEVRTCKQLVAASTNLDSVLLEFNGSLPTKSLVLGNINLKKNMRLEMLGFPVDKFANRSLNMTQNCWIMKPSLPIPSHSAKGILDRNFGHNCSTYGGNSGGPMILEGTNMAIGLPNAYGVEAYGNRKSSEFTEGINFDLLISKFQKEITIFKVAVSDVLPSSRPRSKKLSLLPGVYKSGSLKDWKATVKPVYNTNSYLTSIELWWENTATGKTSHFTYKCSKGRLCSENADSDPSSITGLSNLSFSYYKGDKRKKVIFKLVQHGHF